MRYLLFFCLSLVLACGPALAIEPEKREAIVISGRVWDGGDHREIFVPSDIDRLVVVSGRDSIVSFVRTWEYYWPLARKSYVDFETMREPVEGTLVLTPEAGPGIEVPAQPYVLVYPEGAAKGNATVLWGQEAEAAYDLYEKGERTFRKALVDAQRAQTEYERQLVEAGKARLEGKGIQQVASPPPLPEASLKLVTKPALGFRLGLQPGTYKAYVSQGGAILEATRRSVTVLDGAGRETLVADIIPEERWTRPIPSDDVSSKIYVRPGATFFMTLAKASQFTEADYLAVVDPQARPSRETQTWVRRGEAAAASLDWTLDGAAQGGSGVLRQRLKVEQTGGSAFGYRVRPAENGEQEDLSAFRFDLPAGATEGRIQAPGNNTVFERQVIAVAPRNGVLALCLALLPIMVLAGKGVASGFVARRSR